jgi:hypothetical protein
LVLILVELNDGVCLLQRLGDVEPS